MRAKSQTARLCPCGLRRGEDGTILAFYLILGFYGPVRGGLLANFWRFSPSLPLITAQCFDVILAKIPKMSNAP